jgi:glutathione S-transferase
MGTEYGPRLVEGLPQVQAWWEELAMRPAAAKVAAYMPLGFGAASKEDE